MGSIEEDRSATAGKVISCKAAVLWGPKEPLVMEEIRVDPPKEMEVRIRILFTSICHTDLGFWIGENEAQRAFPRILGHEASGVIESVGAGVVDLKEGDHVIPIFQGECRECAYCKSENTNKCLKFGVDPMRKLMVRDGTTRFRTKDGTPIYHFLNTSTFSEYTVVDSSCVVKVDDHLPLDKMSLLSCGISTGVGAAWNTANLQVGSTVAIFGLGAVGLAVAAGARARGASRIIGVDINSAKFEKGRGFGVTDFINPKEIQTPVHQEIIKLTNGLGVDVSFECAGNIDVLRGAFSSTNPGWGLTVLLGVQAQPDLLPIHPMELFDGRRITGCTFGGFKGRSQMTTFAKQCFSGAVDLDKFVTHELPFDRINEAIQLLMEGKSLRCIMQL
ncbi:hypothetical protein MLD38_037499 [Melastoma candidum]|uniref:Uncharacterized protein n=1 Tax=Melastoma candidum TaxID=119954 RepID=A0ACB9LNX2_9MYRT|nr:hypothetical protein MLD38_037499 [Melastoma candidum]